MKLTAKTIVLLLSIIFLVMGAFTVLEYRRTRESFTKDFFDSQTLLFSNARTGLGNALWNMDKPSAQAALSPLIASGRFDSFEIYKSSGKLFLSAVRSPKDGSVEFVAPAENSPEFSKVHAALTSLESLKQAKIDTKPQIKDIDAVHHEAVVGIWFREADDKEPEFLGAVTTRFSSQHIADYLVDQRNRLIRVNLVLSALLLGGTFVFLLRSVIRPVERLEKASIQISSGQYVRVQEGTGKDEIASLSRNFNRMAQAIEDNVTELRQINEIAKSLSRAANFNELAASVSAFCSEIMSCESKVCVFTSTETRSANVLGGDESIAQDSGILPEHSLTWHVHIEDKSFGVVEIVGENIGALKKWMEGPVFNSALLNVAFAWERIVKNILENELSAGRLVQETLLPQSKNIPGIDIAASVLPATQTGGDWYGYHYDEVSNTLIVFIGDVTGHGFPSALVTGVVCGAVYAGEMHADQVTKAAGVVNYHERLKTAATVLNNVILETSSRSGRVMTMGIAAFDLNTGKVLYLNAGHNPLLVVQNGKPRFLQNIGPRLGYSSNPQFSIKETQLQVGDSIIFYTDGLVENVGPDGSMLSVKDLKTVVGGLEGTAAQIHDGILASGNSIWKNVAAADDVTVLVVKWVERTAQPRVAAS